MLSRRHGLVLPDVHYPDPPPVGRASLVVPLAHRGTFLNSEALTRVTRSLMRAPSILPAAIQRRTVRVLTPT